MIPLATDRKMSTTLRNRSPNIRAVNTVEAWTSGILLRDFARQGRRAPIRRTAAKEIPTAAPSKSTRKTSIIVRCLFATARRIGE